MSDAGPNFRVTDDDGVAVVLFDMPGRSMNVVDEAVVTELAHVIGRALADPAVVGIVLASGKERSFGGGADLTVLPAMACDPVGLDAFLTRVHDLMLAMAHSHKPIVAAIDGFALGGAFELTLGASTIVTTDRAIVGLPEATLGLLPAGAGTQLYLRRLAPDVAAELLIGGRRLAAADALNLGLVDEVFPPEELLGAAITRARIGRVDPHPFPTPDPALVESARAGAARVRRPVSTNAAAAILDCLERGLTVGTSAGLAAERAHFPRVLAGDESAALIHLFHVETAAKRRYRGAASAPERLGVVGGGQMGAGIASTAVAHGLPAVVRDIDPERLDQARERAGQAGPHAADLLRTTTEWEGFAAADIVVEAVLELPELKRETLRLIDAQVGADALITTNTSAIPVASLAGAVSHPQRFMGTHFFSPVEKMPLLELVPHLGTSEETVARAGGLGRALGKVPVVVADYPGFYTSRVYARWLIEGLRLLADGADPAAIDSEAKAIGFPVGPLQACDEVTLELVRDASVVQVAQRVFLDRLDVPAVQDLLEALISAGHRGKRFGQGFYAYVDGRRSGIDPGLARSVSEAVATPGTGVAAGASGERLLLAFVTESLLCWDDATLCHPDDGDLAATFGIGFPRGLGGPFHWTDRHGAHTVLERIQAQDGTAFPTGTTLPQLAAEGATFATLSRRALPGRR